jgi:hypothetical protein
MKMFVTTKLKLKDMMISIGSFEFAQTPIMVQHFIFSQVRVQNFNFFLIQAQKTVCMQLPTVYYIHSTV